MWALSACGRIISFFFWVVDLLIQVPEAVYFVESFPQQIEIYRQQDWVFTWGSVYFSCDKGYSLESTQDLMEFEGTSG